MRSVADYLGRPLTIRSWNVASLFRGALFDGMALRRRRAKTQFLARRSAGAHVFLVQESRGIAADLIQGSFVPRGTSGGTLIPSSPRIVRQHAGRTSWAALRRLGFAAPDALRRVCAQSTPWRDGSARRHDLHEGSLQLDISVESEAVGTELPD